MPAIPTPAHPLLIPNGSVATFLSVHPVDFLIALSENGKTLIPKFHATACPQTYYNTSGADQVADVDAIDFIGNYITGKTVSHLASFEWTYTWDEGRLEVTVKVGEA